MTDEEVRALLAGASPVPWRIEGEAILSDGCPPLNDGTPDPDDNGGGWQVCEAVQHPADRLLLAAAPELAAEVLRLRAEVLDLACDLEIEQAIVALLKGRLAAEVERCPPGCTEPHGETP